MSRALPGRLLMLLGILLFGAGGPGAHAADTEADEDLLEFLGSVGGEDPDFADYLSKTDIAQVSKPAPRPAPTPTEVNKS